MGRRLRRNQHRKSGALARSAPSHVRSSATPLKLLFHFTAHLYPTGAHASASSFNALGAFGRGKGGGHLPGSALEETGVKLPRIVVEMRQQTCPVDHQRAQCFCGRYQWSQRCLFNGISAHNAVLFTSAHDAVPLMALPLTMLSYQRY